MEVFKNRITKDGRVVSSEVSSDVLKVDSFLNHQIDVKLF